VTQPLNNGTTTGSYSPPPMYTPRPGADAHLAIPSRTTGKAPAKAAAIYLPPPTTIAPKARIMTAPKVQIPAKPVKPATKRKLKDEDHSTPYKPQTVLRDAAPVGSASPSDNATRQPVQAKAAGTKKTGYVDPAGLVICDDPLPAARALPDLKYQAVFDKMVPGKCIKCAPKDVGKVAGGLRNHFARMGITDKIKTTACYEADGMGRVWWVSDKEAA